MYKVIENKPKKISEEFREVWRSLPLAWTLAAREIKARYAHTLLGFVWIVVPLAAYILIYSLFFSVLLRVDTQGIPYPLVAFTGLIGWNYFKDIIFNSGNAIASEGQLLKRNALPKLIMPLFKSLIGLVEFGVSLVLLFLLVLIFGQPFSIKILFLPAIVVLNFLIGFAIAIWVCTYSARRRDLYHLAASGLNVAIWLSPVFYMPNLLPTPYRPILYINPMATVIESYRWALLGTAGPPWYGWASVLIFILLLFLGLRLFFNRQHQLVDYV